MSSVTYYRVECCFWQIDQICFKQLSRAQRRTKKKKGIVTENGAWEVVTYEYLSCLLILGNCDNILFNLRVNVQTKTNDMFLIHFTSLHFELVMSECVCVCVTCINWIRLLHLFGWSRQNNIPLWLIPNECLFDLSSHLMIVMSNGVLNYIALIKYKNDATYFEIFCRCDAFPFENKNDLDSFENRYCNRKIILRLNAISRLYCEQFTSNIVSIFAKLMNMKPII